MYRLSPQLACESTLRKSKPLYDTSNFEDEDDDEDENEAFHEWHQARSGQFTDGLKQRMRSKCLLTVLVFCRKRPGENYERGPGKNRYKKI
jgi:hypothetical protein